MGINLKIFYFCWEKVNPDSVMGKNFGLRSCCDCGRKEVAEISDKY